MAAILLAVAAVCAIGWLSEHVSLLAVLWYLEEKKIPFPSEEEMKRGCKWATRHLVSDLTGRRPKR